VRRIGSDEEFKAICVAGRGVVYNDFSWHGASGGQYNVVHAAACQSLVRSSPSVPKFWFEDLAAATGWLLSERGDEGRAWKRCGICHGSGSSTEPAPPGPRSLTTPVPYVVVAEPGGSRVEAWTSTRLPFEPKGAMMRDFRDDLRSAVARLSTSPTEALHAIYTSPIDGHFDVENVLMYNVGPSAFARSAALELIVERAHGPVPSPPPGLTEARHHYRYEIVPPGAAWRHWAAVRPLASFGPLDVGTPVQVSSHARVWYAVRRGSRQVDHPSGVPSVFGMDLVLEAPDDIGTNLAAVAKPLLDGVVAAFHAHDSPASLDVVASRVAVTVEASVDEIRVLLRPDSDAILGGRQLLWPWRDGVQWNPADDLCAAFRIRRVTRPAGGRPSTLRLWGSIVEVGPVSRCPDARPPPTAQARWPY
jgi:hypothetical protein